MNSLICSVPYIKVTLLEDESGSVGADKSICTSIHEEHVRGALGRKLLIHSSHPFLAVVHLDHCCVFSMCHSFHFVELK